HFFLSSRYVAPRLSPSFPTRRSSDLRKIAWSARAPNPRHAQAPAPSSARRAARFPCSLLHREKERASGARAHRRPCAPFPRAPRSEEHTSELQSRGHLVCRLLLEKKK